MSSSTPTTNVRQGSISRRTALTGRSIDNQMDQDLVVRLNQAAIDGIRSAGAKQWINVEGNHWSGAHSWTTVRWKGQKTNAESMLDLRDPENKTMYQMHQYLDADSSGTHAECGSTNGRDRLEKATEWLKKHKKMAVLGEFASAPGDAKCDTALKNMLEYMVENKDVWKGALW
jgi:endoglucanase